MGKALREWVILIKLNNESRKLIIEFTNEVDLYKRLHKARNELLSGSGYHEKNMDRQIEQLEKANAPKEEIDLIARSWDMQSKLYSQSLKDLDTIINAINKQLSNVFLPVEKELITEEKLNKEYWENLRKIREYDSKNSF